MSYVCPKCREDKCLWRNVEVPGWQAVDGDLKPIYMGGLSREADWPNARSDGTYGCGDCRWEGVKADLVTLGLDGEPLPLVHPQQQTLGVSPDRSADA